MQLIDSASFIPAPFLAMAKGMANAKGDIDVRYFESCYQGNPYGISPLMTIDYR
jgi:hypothetical protein